MDPGHALNYLRLRTGAKTALIGGIPVAIFGLNRTVNPPAPWLIGTRELSKHKILLYRMARAVLRAWRKEYGHLEHHVWAGSPSVRWLISVGCRMYPPRKIQVFGGTAAYRRFTI